MSKRRATNPLVLLTLCLASCSSSPEAKVTKQSPVDTEIKLLTEHCETLDFVVQAKNDIKEGKLESAIKWYSIAISESENANLYKSRADVKIRIGDLGSALLDFNSAIRIDPENSSLYRARSNLYRKQARISPPNVRSYLLRHARSDMIIASYLEVIHDHDIQTGNIRENKAWN